MKNFWSVLWSSEWAANVLVPLVVALIALALAAFALRTQLKSDRDLARVQFRQVQAQRFAQVLEATSEKLEQMADDVQSGGFVFQPDGGRDHLRRLTHRLDSAARRAETTFGQNELTEVVQSSIFNAGPRLARWVEYGETLAAGGQERADTRAATGYVLNEYVALWRAVAESLDAWDGGDEFPSDPLQVGQVSARVSSLRSISSKHLNRNMLLATRADSDEMRFRSVLDTYRANRLGHTA